MADGNYSWLQIKKKYGETIPAKDREDFFAWLVTGMPEGLTGLRDLPRGISWTSKYENAHITGNLKIYYGQWKELPTTEKYLGKATLARYPTGPAAPQQAVSNQDPTGGFATMYLNELRSELDNWAVDAIPDLKKWVEKGEITEDDLAGRTLEEYARDAADLKYSSIAAEVAQTGLHSGLEGIRESGIWDKFENRLYKYAEETILPNGSKVYEYNGFYFNPDASLIPASEQTYIRDIVEQQEEQLRISKDAQTQAMLASAEAGVSGEGVFRPKTAFKDYFDLQDKFNALERPDIKIVSQSDTTPLRGGDNDIIITSGPAEAARLGYGSWVDEREWNSPKVQSIYFSELNKNIQAAVQRLDMSLPEGVTGSQLHGMSIVAKLRLLNPSELSVASQLARSVALESTPSGIKPGWVRIKSSRDPRPGPQFISPEEYKLRRDKKKASKSEMAEIRALGAIEKYKKEKLLKSYRQHALGGEAPEVTKGMSGEALAEYQRKQRLWEKTPEFYELPEERTPGWITQYVPGLTAGQPLRLGHQVTTPSGQGWRTTLPSQRQYLQDYMATSEQVVPGYAPRRTYEDIMHEMGIGKSKTVTGARGWRVSRQRS